MGQIADILQARGQFDEALVILQGDVLDAFEQLGDVRSKAVTMGKIADILQVLDVNYFDRSATIILTGSRTLPCTTKVYSALVAKIK